MTDEPQPRSVQEHPPTQADPEPREETIARVIEESDRAQGVTARHEAEDPTTRRGVNRTVTRRALAFAGIGAIVGAVIGLILSLAPGPFETDSVGSAIGYMIGLAAAVGVITGILATLILLEREDGRVEREVERKTGHGPQPPGRPSDPEHDLEGR